MKQITVKEQLNEAQQMMTTALSPLLRKPVTHKNIQIAKALVKAAIEKYLHKTAFLDSEFKVEIEVGKGMEDMVIYPLNTFSACLLFAMVPYRLYLNEATGTYDDPAYDFILRYDIVRKRYDIKQRNIEG